MQTADTTLIERWPGNSEKWVTSFLQRVLSNSSFVSIIAMGSVVGERGHRRSDFDLLVIHQSKRPVIKAPLEVDIRMLAVDGIENQVARGHEILCWALNFGVALYDPTGFWERLKQSWNNRIPLPSATEARRRGIQTLERAIDMLQNGDESAAEDLVLAALTQFARECLIKSEVFPASRPELPAQLRALGEYEPLAMLLEQAMFEAVPARTLIDGLKQANKNEMIGKY